MDIQLFIAVDFMEVLQLVLLSVKPWGAKACAGCKGRTEMSLIKKQACGPCLVHALAGIIMSTPDLRTFEFYYF